jgi:hypothetical protein
VWQCDIVTQKLGKGVLLFVNTIAEIVHSQVHNWGGQCNKNLGNAFVLVWRIGDEKTLIAANSASILSRAQQKTTTKNNKSFIRSSRLLSYPSYGSMPDPNGNSDNDDGEEDNKSQANGTAFFNGSNSIKSSLRQFNVDLKRVPGNSSH